MADIRDERMEELLTAIRSTETDDELFALLEDLCTVSELLALKQRFWVARLLREGLYYAGIVEQTGASSATISRVNRCLQYGTGGYQTALTRLGVVAEEK